MLLSTKKLTHRACGLSEKKISLGIYSPSVGSNGKFTFRELTIFFPHQDPTVATNIFNKTNIGLLAALKAVIHMSIPNFYLQFCKINI